MGRQIFSSQSPSAFGLGRDLALFHARALAPRHAARRDAWPVPLNALEEVAALALSPKDPRRIERIVALQDRRHRRPWPPSLHLIRRRPRKPL